MKLLSQAQQNSFNFLKEHMLIKMMGHQSNAPLVCNDTNSDAFNTIFTAQVSSREPDLRVGQIRLLYGFQQHTIVLIKERLDCGTFVVVPFSRFSNPATNDEYLLGGCRPAFLQVLQLWLEFTTSGLLLQNSWVIDTLTYNEMQELIIPNPDRCGVEIYNETADPRVAYREDETQRLKPVRAKSEKLRELLNKAWFSGITIYEKELVTQNNTIEVLSNKYYRKQTPEIDKSMDVLFFENMRLMGYGYINEDDEPVIKHWMHKDANKAYDSIIICSSKY